MPSSLDLSERPEAFLSAALILSCQPGPSCWKCSSTSRSIRRETTSLPTGRDCFVGDDTGRAGSELVFLKAASAAVLGSLGRYLFGGLVIYTSPLSCVSVIDWTGFANLILQDCG
jgi:hypothetical protein